jgi:hypothetical protein
MTTTAHRETERQGATNAGRELAWHNGLAVGGGGRLKSLGEKGEGLIITLAHFFLSPLFLLPPYSYPQRCRALATPPLKNGLAAGECHQQDAKLSCSEHHHPRLLLPLQPECCCCRPRQATNPRHTTAHHLHPGGRLGLERWYVFSWGDA